MSATGNKRLPDTTLSIRLSADGLSFFAYGHPELPAGRLAIDPLRETPCDLLEKLRRTGRVDFGAFSRVVVEVNTRRLVLVPLEVFEQGMQADYMAINGVVHIPSEEIITTSAAPGILALIVVSRQLIEFCRSIWSEENVRFASPVARCLAHGLHATLRIHLAGDTAYFGRYSDKLEEAFAIACGAPTDLLYRLSEMPLKGARIEVSGGGNRLAIKELRRYYSRVHPGHAHR